MDMNPAQIATINTLVSGTKEIAQGIGAANQASYSASQYKQAARAAIATGSRGAYAAGKEGKIVESDARAAMAAGGGDPMDPGMTRLLSRVGRDAQYNALAAMFEGEQRAYGLRTQANTYDLQAKQQRLSGITSGLSTMLSQGSTIYDEYYKGPSEKEMASWSQKERNRYQLWKDQPWYKRGQFKDFTMDSLR